MARDPGRDRLTAAAAKITDVWLTVLGFAGLWSFSTVVYYYGWTRQRHFSSILYGVLYCGCPLALLLLVAVIRRIPATARINFFITSAAVAGSVLGFELFLESDYYARSVSTVPVMNVLLDSPDKHAAARELSKKWHLDIDVRSGREVIDDFHRAGIDAVPIVTASNQLFVETPDAVTSPVVIDGREVMPLGAISKKLTVLCNEDGQWVHYQSDSHGFNNPPDVWRGHVEIAALGDSFTHGYCVPTEDAFVPLIRRRHPLTLNLGMSGDGPLLMLATLREYLQSVKPDIVLWFYYEGNDLTDLQRERKSGLLMKYLRPFSQPDLMRQDEIDRAMIQQVPRLFAEEEQRLARKGRNSMANSLRDIGTLMGLRQRFGLIGGLDANDRDRGSDLAGPNMTVFGQVLVDAKTTVESWGGKLEFVYLPEWARYTDYTSWGKSQRDAVLAMVRDTGIPLIDIHPVFEVQEDPLALFPFARPGHYTDSGHQIVAEAVLKAID